MARVVVELPAESYEELQRRAEAAGTSPQALSGALLEAALGASATPKGAKRVPSAIRTRPAKKARPSAARAGGKRREPPSAREILKAAGHLVELSPKLQSLIIPGVTLEEVQDALGRAGGPSLSDIIIEQRGPKV